MKISFGQLFRLIFVLFSLFLLGDAFFRWDGFSYYASFSEFLPSVGLASILWSIVSIVVSLLVWISLKLIEWFCKRIGKEVGIEHLLFYTGAFVLFAILVWNGKRVIWADVHTTIQVKSAVFICTSILSMLVAWLLRKRAGRWITALDERITPLVWLFGILVILSVPLVSYHAWLKDPEGVLSEAVPDTSVPETMRPNIVLVTFDAMAARNMSVYGYQKDTTPFISKWAKNASVFTMAEAGSNFTTPAAASLMTGKRVWTHRTFHIAGSLPVKGNVESLPAVLKANGYFNIALVVNPFASVSSLGMSGSFDIAPVAPDFSSPVSLLGWKFGFIDNILFRAFGEKIRQHNWILNNDFIFSKAINLISRNITQTTVPPDKVFDRFFDIIDDNIKKPFFAWIHVFPPHDPYLPPASFIKDGSTSLFRTYKDQEKLIEESYKYLFKNKRYPEEMQSSVNIMRDFYDGFIKYIDDRFKNFIRELNKRQVENTVIILSSDHGESFEHGYFTHGGPFLFEQVTHIPLIIKVPDQENANTVDSRVSQIDIPATILDLANIPVPSWMEGGSLLPLMRGEKLPERPIFSMNFQENRSRGHQMKAGSIAVWEDDYKLIHYLQKDESLLFNIKNDPGELYNIFDKKPEVSQKLLNIIYNNLKEANMEINAL